MAAGKPAVEFNAIINADRQRRKNEALAQQIFSKNRRASAPGAGIASRKPGTGPSLASRVGVTKRTVSTSAKVQNFAKPNGRPAAGDVDAEWTHDLHSLNNPSAARTSQPAHLATRASRANRNERLHNILHGSASSPATSQFNVVAPKKPQSQLSIRGLAGPYVVMAKNFALGTTIADIESAMTPVGGVALSCRIIAERPSVIAEIIFESKEGADNVVETFNNQNADGNILHVYHKIGASAPKLPVSQAASTAPAARSATPVRPRADARPDSSRPSYAGTDRYASGARNREQRRDYGSRDEVMDGSYGFEDRMETDDDKQYENGPGQGRLYSDTIVGNRGRGSGNTRDRGRGNDRSRGYR